MAKNGEGNRSGDSLPADPTKQDLEQARRDGPAKKDTIVRLRTVAGDNLQVVKDTMDDFKAAKAGLSSALDSTSAAAQSINSKSQEGPAK